MNTNFADLPNKAPDYDLRDLLEAGCHFGHQKAKWNPHMAEWIYMEKDGVHIFDLAKTAAQLQLAYNFAYDLGAKGKTVVMVGTKRQAREIVSGAAKQAGVSYIVSRWLGGFLTNWEQVKQSIKKMNEIETGLKNGKYDGYTKFERVQLEKEQNKLERFFLGVKDVKSTPDCVFVVDPKREIIAITEARAEGVPVVALIDSNADPDLVDLPIPANDDAVKSIRFIVDQFAAGYMAGKAAK
ncbi:MAG: 30S ribosomal protein S2 [Candidatus Pacebacteria bacterium]|nr:30S ribosomal protein S2 [Candidatus Paceibacterota bacterium]PIR63979.1 MAG: 30S ribosomal protein S2 [Candidatus Pacebacteria bacterium CG10_big_fil_rev_8_21_14_0_10_40_26]PIZ79094.1 MAG: 30S ribosomal protein S2 [Candidatus Pacebacteria bacterium CG_4_10_14_0_2_um_filter_40_20]PJA69218.1 MAG: 30S ribosomal protein S2 [Candidatus Pacebacteria bacterium CG_4_9_14_3_um_filter_40_12]PJC42060.1 MAG: 30S ribosomal protein S2 [Candidatus Pacebacteria bacterium CG_4_9_14_0_2_um_filter_40_15]